MQCDKITAPASVLVRGVFWRSVCDGTGGAGCRVREECEMYMLQQEAARIPLVAGATCPCQTLVMLMFLNLHNPMKASNFLNQNTFEL